MTCETSDDGSDSDQCGLLLLALAGVDGDFLQYRVRMASLVLRHSDGSAVELFPDGITVDFANLEALAELATAATLPVGSYTRAELLLDYRDSEILLQIDGELKPAAVVDAEGGALEEVTVSLQLDINNQAVIHANASESMNLTFDLVSSHVVAFNGGLQTQLGLFPVLAAEVDPLGSPGFVLRGRVINVDEAEDTYRIAVRPFYLGEGRFGGLNIETDSETVWRINGETYLGEAGLNALTELGAGVETLAQGRVDHLGKHFIADRVLVGASVLGAVLDGVEGHVVSRTEDNRIFIQGGRLWLFGFEPVYRDIVEVQLEPTTEVFNPYFPDQRVAIDDISIGQRVRIFGDWQEDQDVLDARRAHLLLTRLTAIGKELNLATLEAVAVAFGRWPAGWFNFLGTGSDADSNSDPNAYAIDVRDIDFTPLPFQADAPLAVWGFAAPFGSAPPDYIADGISDFSDVGARLWMNWVPATADAFEQIDPIRLRLNPDASFGAYHDLIRAALITDIFTLDALPDIEPVEPGEYLRGIYVIAQPGNTVADLVMYSDFSDFIADLNLRVNRGATLRNLHASGGYRIDPNRFIARGLAVLLEPVDNSP
ncbi:hypothetical protein [Microbulbifer aggregans]|uniref:hypothetical protein n=1 Tax=Microbulbifer aggregans TaxID=1769779 RepID=UPI001CFE181C|nr:hypothetical protein [Microbulbifer aggregans]